MKFRELPIGHVFNCDMTNGLSQKIGCETMRKVSDTRAKVILTTWDIPLTDARRRLHDSTGETVIMLVPNFDPEIQLS